MPLAQVKVTCLILSTRMRQSSILADLISFCWFSGSPFAHLLLNLNVHSDYLGELIAMCTSVPCHQLPDSELVEMQSSTEICIFNRHLGVILMQGVFGPPWEKHCCGRRILNSQHSEERGKPTGIIDYTGCPSVGKKVKARLASSGNEIHTQGLPKVCGEWN